MIPIHKSVKDRLDSFYESKKIPHIIFHGSSGTGKRTIVHEFLNKIYDNDKQKMKSNIMMVNCAHGKGIKFIRDELKFFAKSNIQFNKGVMFKTIVLLNADFLTIDAQSALRRCIELFSSNTRFFIIVENKNKLLNPILSRFCEIHIPEHKTNTGETLNLHKLNLSNKFQFKDLKVERKQEMNEIMERFLDDSEKIDHIKIVGLCGQLYELGYSALDLIDWVKQSTVLESAVSSEIVIRFYQIKSEYRCEKLLLVYLLDACFI